MTLKSYKATIEVEIRVIEHQRNILLEMIETPPTKADGMWEIACRLYKHFDEMQIIREINTLMTCGFVDPVDGVWQVTDKGKEFVEKLEEC